MSRVTGKVAPPGVEGGPSGHEGEHVGRVGTGRVAAQRSVYLDALRAVALIRVVVYHASDRWWVTAFTAMPLMFFIAGTLYAASLERRPARQVISDRYRRILVPYWVYLVAMVVLWASLGVLGQITPANWVGFLFPVVSMNGPQGPGPDTILHLTWFSLWYIQMHLILTLVGRGLRTAQQRHGRALWLSFLGLFCLSAVVAPALAIAVFYAARWIIGYYHFGGTLDTWLRRRWIPLCAACAPTGAFLFLAFHSRMPVLAAFGVALLGAFWLGLAIGLQPTIEPHLTGRRVRSVINWFSQRSLTIYLWHGVALWIVFEYALPGWASLAPRLAWCALILVVTVALLGWAEDLAARRPVQLWPRLPSSRHREPTIDIRDVQTTRVDRRVAGATEPGLETT